MSAIVAPPAGFVVEASALALDVGFVVLALANAVWATALVFKWLQRRGMKAPGLAIATFVVGIGMLLGGWIIADAFLIIRVILRALGRKFPPV